MQEEKTGRQHLAPSRPMIVLIREKCDATRPICANCQRPRPRANPGGPVICTWDDKPSPSADGDGMSASSGSRSKKRKDHDENGGKKARLHELEERVGA